MRQFYNQLAKTLQNLAADVGISLIPSQHERPSGLNGLHPDIMPLHYHSSSMLDRLGSPCICVLHLVSTAMQAMLCSSIIQGLG
jgi:hypothetical protein